MRTIIVKEINQDMIIPKSNTTEFTCIDLYTEINDIRGYIGCINDVEEITIHSNHTITVNIKGMKLGSIIHNAYKLEEVQHSKNITTYTIYTRII